MTRRESGLAAIVISLYSCVTTASRLIDKNTYNVDAAFEMYQPHYAATTEQLSAELEL